jgi:hypothetical protein
MDIWIGVLGFVLFLGFTIAVMVCTKAIKRSADITIQSRLHHSFGSREVVYANVGLVVVVLLLVFRLYTFVPGGIMFVVFVLLTTRIKSGITEDGAIIGTTFLTWEQMESYKLVNDETDSNIITLKIRANHKQYVLVCDREDRYKIAKIMRENYVRITEVDLSAKDTWNSI